MTLVSYMNYVPIKWENISATTTKIIYGVTIYGVTFKIMTQ